MNLDLSVTFSGLESLNKFVGEIPATQRRVAALALNKTSERARAASARRMREQINFPGGYLDPGQNRLVVDRKASSTSLETSVLGRTRPTSLARFVVGNPQPRSGDEISVAIKTGRGARRLDRAFMVRLKSGNTDTKNNLGLAVRTGNGQKPDNAYKPKQLGNGVYLLYGPSVSQVFKATRYEIEPDTLKFLSDEYDRLLKVNLK